MELRLKDIINVLIIGVFLGTGFMVINGTNVFHYGHTYDQLSLVAFLILFVLAVFSFAGLIIYNIVKNGYRPSYIIAGVFGLLFIGGMIAILILNKDKTYHVNLAEEIREHEYVFTDQIVEFKYPITGIERMRYIFQYLTLLMSTYLIVDIIPKVLDGRKAVALGSILIISFALFCVIFSYFKDHERYALIFGDLTKGELFLHSVSSFFSHKNYFGFLLFLATISSLYLHQYKSHFWWIITAMFFYSHILFTWDKSSLLITTVFLVAYFIYRFLFTLRLHKKMNIIGLSATLGTIVVFVVTLIIICSVNIVFKDSLIKSFTTRGTTTFASRRAIWKLCTMIFGQTNIIIGAGYKSFAELIRLFDSYAFMEGGVYSAHNAYLEMLGTGGILLLLAFFAITAYLIYLSIKYFRAEHGVSMFTMILITVVFAYMMVESGSFLFSQTLDYGYLSIICCVPILSVHQSLRRGISIL